MKLQLFQRTKIGNKIKRIGGILIKGIIEGIWIWVKMIIDSKETPGKIIGILEIIMIGLKIIKGIISITIGKGNMIKEGMKGIEEFQIKYIKTGIHLIEDKIISI